MNAVCELSDSAMRRQWIAAFLAELVRILPDYVVGEEDHVAAERYMFQTSCSAEEAAREFSEEDHA